MSLYSIPFHWLYVHCAEDYLAFPDISYLEENWMTSTKIEKCLELLDACWKYVEPCELGALTNLIQKRSNGEDNNLQSMDFHARSSRSSHFSSWVEVPPL